MNTKLGFQNLGHITHAYMVSKEGTTLPMFELDDGKRYYPELVPTGSCWMLYWKEDSETQDPVITPPDEQGKAKINHLGYVLMGMVIAMVVMLIVIIYGYGLF